jgi:hypothetical protein
MVADGLGSALVEDAGTNELSRVLIALNAIIPDTATTCRSKTISSARDNFMFGSGISSKSIPADAAEERRAVAAHSLLCLRSRRIFIGRFGPELARARGIDRLDRRNF